MVLSATALESGRERPCCEAASRPIMRVLAVIPARFGSTRLPGKALIPVLGGEPMIVHVVRAALAARTVNQVLVATDHEEIAKAVEGVGAHAVMTDSGLPTGTDRVAAAMRLTGASANVVVNVQGDEPLIEPSAIDLAAQLLLTHDAADIATLSSPIAHRDLLDPNKVKVVCGATLERSDGDFNQGDSLAVGSRRALFFSRAPIGVDRTTLSDLLASGASREDDTRTDGQGEADSGRHLASYHSHAARLHVGLYAFRPPALQRFVSLPPSPLEAVEQLEQMRALEAGMTIAVGEVSHSARGVDTEDDLRWLESRWRLEQQRLSRQGRR